MAKTKPEESWIEQLNAIVAQRPIVLVKLEDEELHGLKETSDGVLQFSLARPHHAAKGIVTPCVCLFFAEKARPFGGQLDQEAAFMAVFRSRAAITTFSSRLAFRRGVEVQPSSSTELGQLFAGSKFEKGMKERLARDESFVSLGPRGSVELVSRLLKIEANRGALRVLAGGLTKPAAGSKERLQVDALKTALSVFGLSEDEPAATMNLAKSG